MSLESKINISENNRSIIQILYFLYFYGAQYTIKKVKVFPLKIMKAHGGWWMQGSTHTLATALGRMASPTLGRLFRQEKPHFIGG